MRNVKKLAAGAAAGVAGFLALVSPVLAYGYTYDYTTSAADAGAAAVFGGSFLVIWCCVAIGGLLVALGLAYWVYTDAKKHNVENAILWAILTFFFTLIGLLVYFLAIRPDAIKKMEGGAAPKKE